MKKGIFYLKDLPRLMNDTLRIREMAWMPEHIYMHRNRVIEAPHLCFTLRREQGVSKVFVNGELHERSASAPRVGLVPQGLHYHTVQPVCHDELYFIYEPEDYERLLAMMPENRNFELTSEIQAILSELFSNLDNLNRIGTADRLDLLAVRLLLETHIASRDDGASPVVHPRIYEIASYFSTHFTSDIQFEDIYKKFGFSKRSFYRCWQQYSKISPVHFLQEKRLHYAKHLLENTVMTIKEVAQESGFRNSIYFTQSFSRHFGFPPTRCRTKVAH